MSRSARRLIAAVLCCGAVALAPASGAAEEGPTAADAAAPARLLVTAQEWSLSLSRRRIDAGDAIVQLHNLGEDAHDVKLRRVGGRGRTRVPETASGSIGEVRANLRAGGWRLWCTLPGHRQLGMEAELRVRKHR